MKGIRRERTKPSLNSAGLVDESAVRPQSRSLLAKPDMDFAATVEKGMRIKDNIRKKFEESFSQERTEQEALFAKEVLSTTASTPASLRRGGVSLTAGSSLVDGHVAVNPFTPEDSFVPTNPRIGVFPIADARFFPNRRKSTGWEVGLREYHASREDRAPREQIVLEPVPVIVAEPTKVPDAKPAPSVAIARSARLAASDSDLQRQESSRPRTKREMRILPDPTEEEKSKYFGEEAKLKFYTTYHQLSSQADMLLGGFDTLHEVVKSNDPANVLLAAMTVLEADGALTPRLQPRPASKYPATPKRGATPKTHKRGGGSANSPLYGQSPRQGRSPISTSRPSSPAAESDLAPSLVANPKGVLKTGDRLRRPINLAPLRIFTSASDMSVTEDPLVTKGSCAQSVQWSGDPTSGDGSGRSRLDDKSYVDESGELTYSLASPRAIFLSGCLKHSLPPRAQVLLRKRTSSTINLSHMGIGNQMAIVLAESLRDLPHLQVLNLCDNNLEDSGLKAILCSIKNHPTLEIVDISQNTIDEDAAAALADLVGNSQCQLRCLRMSDANIDDSECSRFVQVLMHNRHLQELDMSKNLLGKDENLNAVQPDFETGGESLAELIRAGECPLQVLNLHWNMIRLEGAEVLCDSVRHNRHLMHLDLSYNALGQSAASVLGAALFENHTLQVINVANNGIDAVGGFALFVGLRENQSVRSMVIDGNPIGEQGARMMMKVAASDGHRLEISAKNCDFAVRSAAVKFNIDDPFGEHALNLSQPYDRAILIELMDIVSKDTNIEIGMFEFSDVPPRPATPASARADSPSLTTGGGGGQYFRVVRFEEEQTSRCTTEEAELRHLKTFDKLAGMSPHALRKLLENQDRQHLGYMTHSGLKTVLQMLAVRPLDDIHQQVTFTLDPHKAGTIDLDNLVEYMVTRVKVVQQRVWQLQHRSRCALQPLQRISTGASMRFSLADTILPLQAYLPPQQGFVRVQVIESYDCAQANGVQSYPLCASQCRQVIKIANMSTNPALLLTYAIDSSKLYLEEAQTLYNEIIAKSDDPTPLLSKVLMRMLHASEAKRMIQCYVGDDVVKVRRLKQKLGAAYNPLVGIYSGFYSLDLAQDLDRLCLKKLIERSVSVVEARRRAGLWDTSQHGTWSCFRNERHVGRLDISISPKYFYPMPHKGKLDFDFVHIDRPDIAVCRPEADMTILDCLLLSRLVAEEQREWAVRRLQQLDRAVRRTFLSNGAPFWRPDLGTALTSGEHLYTMLTNLPQRKETRRKALKRELIKAVVVVEKKEKKKDPKNRTSYFSSTASMRKTASMRVINTAVMDAVDETDPGSPDASAAGPPASSPGGGGGSLISAYAQRNVNKTKETVRVFKSLTAIAPKSEKVQRMWGLRLFEVTESSGTDEYKAATMLDFFESELCHLWLLCKHLTVVLEAFSPIGLAPRSNLGSYRVELVVMMFDRLLDLENFDLVLSVLNAEEHAALRARIGILNFFNPCKPEGGQSFDLSRWEERQVVKMMVHLSVIEPGENWLNKQFIFDRGFAPIPGWDLSVTWLAEEGLPKKGLLSFEFFAGDGLQLLGCKVDARLRTLMFALVLVGQRDYLAEIAAADMLGDAPDSRPVRAQAKLSCQRGLVAKIGGEYLNAENGTTPKLLKATTEDVSRHLADFTDITWSYQENQGKFESWLPAE